MEALNKTRKHNFFKDLVLVAVSMNGNFVWNNETGASFNGTHNVQYGFKGSGDIIGIARNGLFLSIEIKTYSAKQSKAQKNFEKQIKKRGGIYYVAKTSAKTAEQMERDAKNAARAIQCLIQASKGSRSKES